MAVSTCVGLDLLGCETSGMGAAISSAYENDGPPEITTLTDVPTVIKTDLDNCDTEGVNCRYIGADISTGGTVTSVHYSSMSSALDIENISARDATLIVQGDEANEGDLDQYGIPIKYKNVFSITSWRTPVMFDGVPGYNILDSKVFSGSGTVAGSATNEILCGQVCTGSSTCIGFSFHATTRVCQTYTTDTQVDITDTLNKSFKKIDLVNHKGNGTASFSDSQLSSLGCTMSTNPNPPPPQPAGGPVGGLITIIYGIGSAISSAVSTPSSSSGTPSFYWLKYDSTNTSGCSGLNLWINRFIKQPYSISKSTIDGTTLKAVDNDGLTCWDVNACNKSIKRLLVAGEGLIDSGVIKACKGCPRRIGKQLATGQWSIVYMYSPISIIKSLGLSAVKVDGGGNTYYGSSNWPLDTNIDSLLVTATFPDVGSYLMYKYNSNTSYSSDATKYDCQVSSGSWSPCTRQCKDLQKKTDTLTRVPMNLGTACPGLTSTRQCTITSQCKSFTGSDDGKVFVSGKNVMTFPLGFLNDLTKLRTSDEYLINSDSSDYIIGMYKGGKFHKFPGGLIQYDFMVQEGILTNTSINHARSINPDDIDADMNLLIPQKYITVYGRSIPTSIVGLGSRITETYSARSLTLNFFSTPCSGYFDSKYEMKYIPANGCNIVVYTPDYCPAGTTSIFSPNEYNQYSICVIDIYPTYVPQSTTVNLPIVSRILFQPTGYSQPVVQRYSNIFPVHAINQMISYGSLPSPTLPTDTNDTTSFTMNVWNTSDNTWVYKRACLQNSASDDGTEPSNYFSIMTCAPVCGLLSGGNPFAESVVYDQTTNRCVVTCQTGSTRNTITGMCEKTSLTLGLSPVTLPPGKILVNGDYILEVVLNSSRNLILRRKHITSGTVIYPITTSSSISRGWVGAYYTVNLVRNSGLTSISFNAYSASGVSIGSASTSSLVNSQALSTVTLKLTRLGNLVVLNATNGIIWKNGLSTRISGDDDIICSPCQPNYYESQTCTDTTDTVCAPSINTDCCGASTSLGNVSTCDANGCSCRDGRTTRVVSQNLFDVWNQLTGSYYLAQINQICNVTSSIPAQNRCTPVCPAGQYETQPCRSQASRRTCAVCPATKFCPGGYPWTARNCSTCPAGSTTVTACTTTTDTVCQFCAPGYYCPDGTSSSSTICPAGYYCPRDTITPLVCSAGYYCPNTGTQTQEDCPATYYCPNPYTKILQRTSCPPGTELGTNSDDASFDINRRDVDAGCTPRVWWSQFGGDRCAFGNIAWAGNWGTQLAFYRRPTNCARYDSYQIVPVSLYNKYFEVRNPSLSTNYADGGLVYSASGDPNTGETWLSTLSWYKFHTCLGPCNIGEYISKSCTRTDLTKTCSPCTTPTCQSTEFISPCGKTKNATCVPCTRLSCPLGYKIDTVCNGVNNNTCIACPAGTYSSTTDSTSCSNCPAGQFSPSGSAGCIPCPADYYSVSGGQCQQCPAGQHSIEGSASCSYCTAGTEWDSTTRMCIPCNPGYTSDGNGGICSACPAGQYTSDLLSCQPCPIGTYTPAPGNDSCIPCAGGTTTSTTGSTSCGATCTSSLTPGTLITYSEACNINTCVVNPSQGIVTEVTLIGHTACQITKVINAYKIIGSGANYQQCSASDIGTIPEYYENTCQLKSCSVAYNYRSQITVTMGSRSGDDVCMAVPMPGYYATYASGIVTAINSCPANDEGTHYVYSWGCSFSTCELLSTADPQEETYQFNDPTVNQLTCQKRCKTNWGRDATGKCTLPCEAGYYCPQSGTKEVCPAGYYCRDSDTKTPCPSGYFCPRGSTTFFPWTPACTDSYCTEVQAPSSTQQRITRSYSCAGSAKPGSVDISTKTCTYDVRSMSGVITYTSYLVSVCSPPVYVYPNIIVNYDVETITYRHYTGGPLLTAYNTLCTFSAYSPANNAIGTVYYDASDLAIKRSCPTGYYLDGILENAPNNGNCVACSATRGDPGTSVTTYRGSFTSTEQNKYVNIYDERLMCGATACTTTDPNATRAYAGADTNYVCTNICKKGYFRDKTTGQCSVCIDAADPGTSITAFTAVNICTVSTCTPTVNHAATSVVEGKCRKTCRATYSPATNSRCCPVTGGDSGTVPTSFSSDSIADLKLPTFSFPTAIVFDSVGNMYIADAETNMIRKIDTNGIVTTYAGTGAQGSLDGPRTSATFLLPRALAVDSAGNIYVAERLIRKIDTSGTVTTYAGTGVSADIFSAPYGIAFDSAGNLYVADASHKIYKIDTSGTVTTYAGTGTPDSTDGAGDVASFSTPRGLAFDSAGNLYVADYDNSKIRKIDTSRNVTTYASSGFLGPRGLAFDSAGNLYVADSDNQSILKIDTSRNVTTYASGFSYPYGIAFDSAGNLYVADGGNYNIRKIDTSRNVTTYAGGSGRGNQNGTIGSSQTNISTDPRGTVFDKDGNMYTTDSTRHCIYKRDANGNRSLFAGISGTSGSTNGPGVSATFNQPYGIAVDSDGNLYVADSNNHKIRKIDTSGVVSTYAGTGAQGYAGGLWSVAMFNQPYGIAVDSGGNVYVADRNNHTIRMIDNTRTVTTIAGTTGVGYIDGQGITATFSYPTGVAVDSAGNVFVADTNNNKIRKIDNTVNRVVSTYAGTGSTGYNNGPLLSASFTTFKTLAVDSDGNIYGANLTKVRKIDKYRVMTLYTFPSTITSIAVKDHNTIYVSNAVTTVSLSTCKALRCTTNDTNAASTTIDSDGFCRNVCKAGSFRNSAGACEACPQDAVTSTTFSEGCKLNSCEVVNGYERTTKAFTDVSGVCRTVCRPSYVKDGSGICSVCAPGYGRDTDDICSICLDGYAGNADGWCDPCPIDPGVTATYGSGYCVVNTCTPAAGQYIQNILTGTRTSVTTTTAQKVNGKCTSVCVTGVSKDSDGLCTVLTKGYTFPTGQTIQTTELEVGTSSFPFTTSPSPMSSPPNYSMSMDINIAQVGASWRVILGSTDGGDWNVNRPATNTRRPVIGIHGNDSPPANRLYVNHTNANSDFQGQNTNFVATPGSWFNLTFTIDSTSKRGIVYINGVYDSQFSASDFAWSNPVNWTWNNSTYNKYGSVKVRNVYFYNRVLGSSEITNPISLCPRDPDTNVEFIDNSSCALSSCTTDDPNGTTVVDGSGVCRKVCKSITNGQWGVNNVDGKCTVLTCNGNYDPASLCVYVTSVTVTESPGTGTVSTIASLPDGRDTITVDSSGNLYVADGGNNKILIVNTAGVVSPYAGTGQKGSTNGPKASAQFDNPRGLAFDSAGNLYVADLGNNKIRKIDTNGVVSTYAGSGGYGAADGTWSVATFRYPRGLAVDSAGNVYVADTNNHCIRKIDNTVNRNVSTYAGIPGTYGTVDGIWSVATFRSPEGVAVDSVGNLYVADTYLGFIRKIDTNRIVSTLTSANQPRGIAVDSAGNVYVAATYSNRILNIDTNGVVSTIAGSGAYAAVDGPVTSATFMSPQGVTVDSGGNAYVVQANSSGLRKISFSVDQLTKIVRNTRLDINYLVTNLADNLTRILADALIDNIELKIVSTFVSLSFRPSGIAIDSSGNIYVADTVNNKIQKIDSNKSVSVYAGTGASGSADGPWSAATFSSPVGLAFDSDDNMYVADYSSNKIRKIDKSRTVTTYAGTGSPGSTDGQWSSATFSRPSRIAVDSDRNLYVTDSANNKIRKIDNTVNRNVTTYAGSGSQGSTDGQWSSATFSSPNGIAVDSGRNVYITELYTDKIRKIDNTVNRNVTTPILANHPRGVTFSSSGEMYFADSYSQSVRKVDKDGNISIYAGSGGYGTADGLGISATFSFPQGVAVDSSGNVYTTELDSNNIRKIS